MTHDNQEPPVMRPIDAPPFRLNPEFFAGKTPLPELDKMEVTASSLPPPPPSPAWRHWRDEIVIHLVGAAIFAVLAGLAGAHDQPRVPKPPLSYDQPRVPKAPEPLPEIIFKVHAH